MWKQMPLLFALHVAVSNAFWNDFVAQKHDIFHSSSSPSLLQPPPRKTSSTMKTTEHQDFSPMTQSDLAFDITSNSDGELQISSPPIQQDWEVMDNFQEEVLEYSIDGDNVMSTPFQTEFVNAIALCLFASYLLSNFIFMDSQNWRGWTADEIFGDIPFSNWRVYETALKDTPVYTRTFISVMINLVGDWLAQIQWGKKKITDFDLQQTLRNGLIALFFGPLVHYYYQFSDLLFPQGDPINGLQKILMDQSIYVSTKTFIYLFLVNLLRGETLQTSQENAQQKLLPCLIRGWQFWPFAHMITYSVIPPRHRVLWVNMLDLFWSSILAKMANQERVSNLQQDNQKNTKMLIPDGKYSSISSSHSKESRQHSSTSEPIDSS
mmetsp:Transcript_15716/g.20164  ORF Transcript_15716/g.20164 Transcript_15716/m.20164 type:complete len:379 (+) Transcript_15716:45-1181(+)